MVVSEELKGIMDAVIGALIMDSKTSPYISTIDRSIFQDTFPYVEIFDAMKQAFEEGKVIDITVLNYYLNLNKSKATILDVVKITGRVASSAHLTRHLAILSQELAETNMDIILEQCLSQRLSGIRAPEVITFFQKNTVNILASSFVRGIKTMRQSIQDYTSKSNDAKITTFPISSLNQVTFMMKGDVIIVGGRPGAGKTAFGIQVARHVAKTTNKKVAIISIEMTADQLAMRELSNHSGINSHEIVYRNEKKVGISELVKTTEKETYMDNILLVDHIGTDEDLYSFMIVLILQYGVEFILIDYLQLIPAAKPSNNRNSDIEKISRKIKAIAKEYGVTIMPLSQLSRDSDKGTTIRKPKLSDLRDSGSIEQDATIVLLLYRPEAQGSVENTTGESVSGKAMIIVGKNRNGAPGSEIKLLYNGNKYEFEEPQMQLPFNSEEQESPF